MLAKLASGTLPIEIEAGCYISTPKEERYCKVCNLQVVENEFHFIFSCPMYQLERSIYYVDHVPGIGEFMLPDEGKLAYMLSKDNIRATGRLINQIFDKRRTILYKPN